MHHFSRLCNAAKKNELPMGTGALGYCITYSTLTGMSAGGKLNDPQLGVNKKTINGYRPQCEWTMALNQ